MVNDLEAVGVSLSKYSRVEIATGELDSLKNCACPACEPTVFDQGEYDRRQLNSKWSK
jgi:hypothetical protein